MHLNFRPTKTLGKIDMFHCVLATFLHSHLQAREEGIGTATCATFGGPHTGITAGAYRPRPTNVGLQIIVAVDSMFGWYVLLCWWCWCVLEFYVSSDPSIYSCSGLSFLFFLSWQLPRLGF